MYQTLYRKYRPLCFADVCGQDAITTVLKQQSAQGSLTHAYLFCGTRGTGKTTCAKILAKAVNCEHPVDGDPCNQCPSCMAINAGELLDVAEIDAASNNGVENIRKLCEDIAFLPAVAKKRVYIIDEVHMLSQGAFNALLKTLEEPPAHVLFVLATTELAKVPATIRSRCQCFTFSRIPVEVIAARVLEISQKESIPLTEDGALFLARLADGAMRDALSLLETCVGKTESLDAQALERLFGLGNGEEIVSLCAAALSGDAQTCVSVLDHLYQAMNDMKLVANELLHCLNDTLLLKIGAPCDPASVHTAAQEKVLSDAAAPLNADAILYAMEVLEETLIRFERLQINKKTLLQIALLRICNPADAPDARDALSLRLARVEEAVQRAISVNPASAQQGTPASAQKATPASAQAASPVSAPREISRTKEDAPLPTSNTDAVVNAEKQAAVKPKQSVPASGNALGDHVRRELSKDSLLKPYLKDAQIATEDHALLIAVPPFTRRIMQNSEARILSAAQSVDSVITRVLFVEPGSIKTEKDGNDNGDLPDLNDF